MDLIDSMHIAGSGMGVQSSRLRVIAQNVANADSISLTPGGDPYRRKTISFRNVMDREMGIPRVVVNKIGVDRSDFIKKYEPGNPAADAQGYVNYPNVSTIVEMVDMKEAQRAYEANLNVIEVSKSMIQNTLAVIR